MIQWTCSACGSTFSVGDWMAGKIIACPRCRAKVRLPTAAATAWQQEDVVPVAVVPDRCERDPAPAASLPVKGPDEKYCQECGAVIRAKAVICPKCGVKQERAVHSASSPGKATAIAVMIVVAGLFCGLHAVAQFLGARYAEENHPQNIDLYSYLYGASLFQAVLTLWCLCAGLMVFARLRNVALLITVTTIFLIVDVFAANLVSFALGIVCFGLSLDPGVKQYYKSLRH